jgi:membrane protease YdiL (CAAX protease family)
LGQFGPTRFGRAYSVIMVNGADNGGQSTPRNLIAPAWHTLVLLAFLAILLVSGAIVQHQKTPSNQIFASHSVVMARFYIPVLILEWLLVVFVWFGIRKRGVTLNELVGGRWSRPRDVVVDFALGLLTVILMLAIGAGLGRILGPGHAKSADVILPQGALEMALWVVISFTAGIVEELVYRGYLQSQFVRMGLPVGVAILAQAAVFSASHIYEGLNAVIIITVYGVLFGLLACWRKSLRPGMTGHFAFDFLAAFLPRG